MNNSKKNISQNPIVSIPKNDKKPKYWSNSNIFINILQIYFIFLNKISVFLKNNLPNLKTQAEKNLL